MIPSDSNVTTGFRQAVSWKLILSFPNPLNASQFTSIIYSLHSKLQLFFSDTLGY